MKIEAADPFPDFVSLAGVVVVVFELATDDDRYVSDVCLEGNCYHHCHAHYYHLMMKIVQIAWMIVMVAVNRVQCKY
jgi:hypothetical protein